MTGATRVLMGLLSLILALGMGLASAQEKQPAREAIVVVAKHCRTRGPCIQFGDVRVMPLIDAFEVREVVAGALPSCVKSIDVRALSGHLEAKEGELYLLTLTPTADTKLQLKDRAKDRYSWVWVNAGELTLQKKPK